MLTPGVVVVAESLYFNYWYRKHHKLRQPVRETNTDDWLSHTIAEFMYQICAECIHPICAECTHPTCAECIHVYTQSMLSVYTKSVLSVYTQSVLSAYSVLTIYTSVWLL